MKVLIDESLDVRLHQHLSGHDTYTVQFMGWKGLKNGVLLARAATDGFDVVLTYDQNIQHQQNLATLPVSVVILDAASNQIDDLLPLVPALLHALSTLKSCTLRHVP
jgi:predicted nuclease of predicted toxin-antitoxin system